MSSVRLQDIEMLHLLWLLPALACLFVYAARQRRRALYELVHPEMLKKVAVTTSPAKRAWKAVLVIFSMVFLVLALARPVWNLKATTIKQQGRDVVFLLDVSKSMLAEDLTPNRLERAKLAILDCIARLQGDRVALVAFSGSATIRCPLTLDYTFFRMMVDDISIDSVSRGGTMLGDALRTLLDQVFDDQAKQYKDIILITDGGDQESFPVEAAQAAGERGIRLIVIGLGDEKEGSRIPILDSQGRKTFLKHNGREVWTKLDASTLRKMADATPGGKYLPVATGAIDLGEVYMKLVAAAEKKELEEKTIKRYEEKFQIFLTAALLLLVIEALFSEQRRNNGNRKQPLIKAALLLMMFSFAAPLPVRSASIASLVESGNKEYEAGKYDHALDLYDKALEKEPEAPYILFNRGAALYKKGDFDGARSLFTKAGQSSSDQDFLAANKYNMGNAAFRRAEQDLPNNPQKALEGFRHSVDFYRQALDLDANLQAAGQNLEAARFGIQQALEKIEERQQRAKMEQQAEDNIADALQNLIARQQEAATKTGKLAENGEQGSASEEEAAQHGIRRDTKNLQQKMAKTENTAQEDLHNRLDQAKEYIDNAVTDQLRAEKNLQAGNYNTAQPLQENAALDLQKALDALRGKESREKRKAEKSGQKQQGENDRAQSQEAAATTQQVEPPQEDHGRLQQAEMMPSMTARDILNEEKRNQLQRQRTQGLGYQEVDKDW